MNFLYPGVPARRAARSRFRSCCTCCGATWRRTCRSPRCGCCSKSPVERSRRRRCAICCCWPRVSPRCCCSRRRSRVRIPRVRRPPRASCASLPSIGRSAWARPAASTRALDLARRAIDEAGFAERVAVIAFDERAEVVALPGGAADARAALKGSRRATAPRASPRSSTRRRSSPPAVRRGLSSSAICSARAGTARSRAHAPASLKLDIRDAGTPSVNVAVSGMRASMRPA